MSKLGAVLLAALAAGGGVVGGMALENDSPRVRTVLTGFEVQKKRQFDGGSLYLVAPVGGIERLEIDADGGTRTRARVVRAKPCALGDRAPALELREVETAAASCLQDQAERLP